MKKFIIPFFLIVSLTISAQFTEYKTINFGNALSFNYKTVTNHLSNTIYDSLFEVNEEEEDEPFDFDIQNYLPIGFNPYKLMFEAYSNIFEYLFDEEDESFDFDTKLYLPEEFDPYIYNTVFEEYELLNEEEDASFDFDTKEYLPKGFSPYYDIVSIEEYELMNEEEVISFDFDTKEYLPEDFDANKV